MKRMKSKLLAVLLGVTLAVTMTGCGKEKETPNEGQENNTETSAQDIIAVKDMGKVELGQYKGIEVTVQDTTVTDAEVESYMNQFIEDNKMKEEITDRSDVQNGDIANINYIGKINGVAFERGADETEEGTDLEIGSGTFIPGFEEQLIGLKTGETKDITVTFPEDYDNEDLKGKEAVFTVTINKIYKEITPELTDELVAEKATTGSTTVDELRQYYRDSIKTEKEASAESQWQNDAATAAIDNSTFSDINDGAVSQDREQMSQYYEYMAQMYGMDAVTMVSLLYGMTAEQYNEQLDIMALFTVKQKIIALEIAKQENVQITEEEYQASLETYFGEVSGSFDSKEKFEEEFGRELIEENIMVEKGMQFIFDNVVKK